MAKKKTYEMGPNATHLYHKQTGEMRSFAPGDPIDPSEWGRQISVAPGAPPADIPVDQWLECGLLLEPASKPTTKEAS